MNNSHTQLLVYLRQFSGAANCDAICPEGETEKEVEYHTNLDSEVSNHLSREK